MRVAIVAVALVGCAAEGHQTIDLRVSSAYDVRLYGLLRGTSSTAVGGTQTYFLSYPPEGDPRKSGRPFDLPYRAVVVDDDCVEVVDQSGPEFTLRGVHEGLCSIAIESEDGFEYNRLGFGASAIDSIVLEPLMPGGVANQPLAWWPGQHAFGVTPRSVDGFAIADSSMTIALAGADVLPPHDGTTVVRIAGAPLGTHSISIVAGGNPWSVDYVVSDRADLIVVVRAAPPEPIPTTVKPGTFTSVCFRAHSDGRTLIDPPWSMSATGVVFSHVETGYSPSINGTCLAVLTDETAGDVTFTASLAGQALSITLPIVP